MPSVLDTFFILFKTDASDVEEGSKKAKDAVDKLETSIGGADKKALSLGASFNTLATGAVAAFASVFAVTQLISGAKGIAAQSQELTLLSQIIGESATEITNWGRAVESIGGDAKTFQGSLRGLNTLINDSLVSGPNDATKALGILGIAAVDATGKLKSPLDLLPEIAKEFEGLTRVDQQALGKMLGLDEGTILLLSRGEREVGNLVARQAGMNRLNDEQLVKLAELNIKWREFKNLLSDASAEMLVEAIPGLEKMEEGLLDFIEVIKDNEDIVMIFLKGLGVILGALAIKAAALAAPFLLTAAAILAAAFALGLLVEDMEKFMSGEDSVVGRAGVTAKRFFTDLSGNIDVQQVAAIASGNPIQILAAAATAGIRSAVTSQSKTMTIGGVTVETQATDAGGVAQGLGDALREVWDTGIDIFDDGVSG